MTTRVVVGTRGSRLARTQAERVAARLRIQYPGLEIEIREIATAGDLDRHTQLENMGTNVFVKELEEALLDGRIDLAVHSLKDLPTDLPAGLGVVCIPEREDPRDVLVAATRLEQLPQGARVGTGSLRRSIQLARLRPDLQAVGIRGNVETRVRKVASGELEGVVLAAAGLNRLGLGGQIWQYLPVESFLPAAGQGALALEARLGDEEVGRLAGALNDQSAAACVNAERAFLRELGGGCRAPIAALAELKGGQIFLSGMAASPDGRRIIKDTEIGSRESAVDTGRRLAQRMLKMGALKFIDEVKALEKG